MDQVVVGSPLLDAVVLSCFRSVASQTSSILGKVTHKLTGRRNTMISGLTTQQRRQLSDDVAAAEGEYTQVQYRRLIPVNRGRYACLLFVMENNPANVAFVVQALAEGKFFPAAVQKHLAGLSPMWRAWIARCTIVQPGAEAILVNMAVERLRVLVQVHLAMTAYSSLLRALNQELPSSPSYLLAVALGMKFNLIRPNRLVDQLLLPAKKVKKQFEKDSLALKSQEALFRNNHLFTIRANELLIAMPKAVLTARYEDQPPDFYGDNPLPAYTEIATLDSNIEDGPPPPQYVHHPTTA
ncbi:hypothetical protein IWQ60_009624 [Tieghemiomyces parasiticus]|uniref:Uncharacterized protein n=1 Tax=Tieghemiomyces parasiticus TaxID=78921 RepID=A0A9W7ZSN0_9FUNG|nr:hypothetical protein IWQ60_009624 [Tieghemiomyces parasiticus]